MGAGQPEVVEPGPEAVAYGQALKAIYAKQADSQNKVAARMDGVDPPRLSRYFSGQLIAGKPHAEALVRVVREDGAEVTDAEIAELHRLRRAAQDASPASKDRVSVLQEQMDAVKAMFGAVGQVLDIDGAHSRLHKQIDVLSKRVREEELRSESERHERLREQQQRKQAEQAASVSAAELAQARRQLGAATDYARQSDATIEAQQEQLRQLRRELEVLRRQVRRLTEEAPTPDSGSVARPARQVSAVADRSGAVDKTRQDEPAQTWGARTPAAQVLNADVAWDAFDPDIYIAHNYRTMQAVDEEIVSLVRDHFSDHFRHAGPAAAGIDVGAGPNLYPALAMLPFADRITLLERSTANLNYLRHELPHYSPHWDQFWDVLCQDPAYAHLYGTPRERFSKAVQLQHGSLFDLWKRTHHWNLGAMFFVAESITTSHEEVQHAISCFLHALTPGAPFAAAFMEHSQGYRVGDVDYPARDIDQTSIETALDTLAQETKTYRLTDAGHLIRHAHSGIILVCGRRKQ
ncbi:SCO2525 family SAM-dependent methyltransferase [Streptomyces sp. NBC_00191]|uniref:SCO2525 family SAM-dependent methyltransferase n=1 Tax=Streptomyces sp. NBC_00191 TaxID=2975674 RepID=UPI00386C46AA